MHHKPKGTTDFSTKQNTTKPVSLTTASHTRSLSPPRVLYRSDIMADDPHNTSDISDQNETVSAKEDAETTAARRELKQASISEKDQAGQSLQKDDQSGSGSDDGTTTKDNDSVTGRSTPESGNEDGMRERISSPKKKRVYDELDEPKPTDNANEKPLAFGPAPSRTDRSEPEKKRPRDRNSKSSDEEVVNILAPLSLFCSLPC